MKFSELFNEQKNSKEVNNIKTQYAVPWTDKYRPTKLSEIIYQDEVVNMLSNVLETGNLPHLLFYGFPGSGKTTCILAIARQLFGPKKFKERVIELNASDERGINVVRNKIVTIAKRSVSEKDPNYVCPPFKLIILDEADAMTTEAQSALRKTMEDYSNITRFCFICNYINQIITPISSRCVKFRFKSIEEQHMSERLKFIATSENMNISNQAVHKIAKISNGDMRKGIMLLQNLRYQDTKIKVSDVFNQSNMISPEKLYHIIEIYICNKSNNMMQLNEKVNELIVAGYPVNILLTQLVECIIATDKLTDKMKSVICYHISLAEKRLVDGASEYLQLLSIFVCMKSAYLGVENYIYKKID
jgi:replication factor C subunit 2/4